MFSYDCATYVYTSLALINVIVLLSSDPAVLFRLSAFILLIVVPNHLNI